jgi:hypothetical protein
MAAAGCGSLRDQAYALLKSAILDTDIDYIARKSKRKIIHIDRFWQL